MTGEGVVKKAYWFLIMAKTKNPGLKFLLHELNYQNQRYIISMQYTRHAKNVKGNILGEYSSFHPLIAINSSEEPSNPRIKTGIRGLYELKVILAQLVNGEMATRFQVGYLLQSCTGLAERIQREGLIKRWGYFIALRFAYSETSPVRGGFAMQIRSKRFGRFSDLVISE